MKGHLCYHNHNLQKSTTILSENFKKNIHFHFPIKFFFIIDPFKLVILNPAFGKIEVISMKWIIEKLHLSLSLSISINWNWKINLKKRRCRQEQKPAGRQAAGNLETSLPFLESRLIFLDDLGALIGYFRLRYYIVYQIKKITEHSNQFRGFLKSFFALITSVFFY